MLKRKYNCYWCGKRLGVGYTAVDRKCFCGSACQAEYKRYAAIAARTM